MRLIRFFKWMDGVFGHKSQFVYDDIHCNWSYDNSCLQPIYIRWICIKTYMYTCGCAYVFAVSAQAQHLMKAHTSDCFHHSAAFMHVCGCALDTIFFLFQTLCLAYSNEMFNIFITSNVVLSLSRIEVSFCSKYVHCTILISGSNIMWRTCAFATNITHCMRICIRIHCLVVSRSSSFAFPINRSFNLFFLTFLLFGAVHFMLSSLFDIIRI